LIRTVWLALICLITLIAMAAVKVGTASLVSADASHVVMPAGSNIGQALMKSDKLEVLNIELPAKRDGDACHDCASES
jgi:hypothetical protein